MLPSPIREKEEQMHAVRTAAGAAGSQALLDGFTRYLRAERGVSALTVDAYCPVFAASLRAVVEATWVS
jgi:molybdopterin synthase catalytic subunit